VWTEILGEDATKVGFGTARRRAVVVREVEMGDAEVECASQNCAVHVGRTVEAEIVPEPKGNGR
jgi:hypothetical protein